VTKLPDGAVLSNSARHAIFVELGRRPGRQPPVQAILEWMIAKRFRPARGSGDRDKQLRSVARLIARKIGRKGTKGRHVLRRTMPGLQRRLRLEMAIAMRKAFERAGGR
jgi:hypothetical protein